MILILDGQQVLVMLNSRPMTPSGITQVDGDDAEAAKAVAYTKPVFPLQEQTQVRLQVRGEHLKIHVGDQVILDWQGKKSRITLPAHWAIPNKKLMMIGGTYTLFQITRLELIPVAATEPKLAAASPVAGPADSLEPKKTPLPTAASLADARKTIRELFQKDYNQAKNTSGKVALAQTLLSRASELQGDSNGRCAMLAEAAEIAAAVGDLALALQALEEVDLNFAPPALELKEKVAKIAGLQAKSPDQVMLVIELQLSLIRDALALDDIALAEQSSRAAISLSRKPGIPIVRDQLLVTAKEIATYKSAFSAADVARKLLLTQPDNPAANLAWGKYQCFIKGDWTNGRPLLVKSQDAALVTLVQRDLEPPVDADGWILLGDDWWAFADLEKEPARTNIWLHAVEAYYRALPNVTDQKRSSVERKISRLFGSPRVFTSTDDPKGAPLADAAFDLETNATVECWIQTRDPGCFLFCKRIQETDSTLCVRLYDGCACLTENASFRYSEARSKVIVDDGIWHHIAIVKAGTNAALFIDGRAAAKLEVANKLPSKSPWRLGSAFAAETAVVKACKFRISNIARYIVSFKPDQNYKKDKATMFLSDLK